MEQGRLTNVIDALRFPLMFLVIVIHSTFMNYGVEMGSTFMDMQDYPVYTVAVLFVTEHVCRVAVPLFFFLSGFLFFYRLEGFAWREYGRKLRKRIFTLLIPYVLWNFIYALLYGGMQALFPSMLSGRVLAVADYSVADWFNRVWGLGSDGPIAAQFWFIRDLMVMVLLTPIIYFLFSSRRRVIGIGLMTLCLANGVFALYEIPLPDIGYFMWGAYYGMTKKDFSGLFSKALNVVVPIYFMLVAFGIFHLLTEGSSVWYTIPRNLSIPVGMICMIGIVDRWVERRTTYRAGGLWAGSSFFLFAYHGMLCPLLCKLALRSLPSGADWMALGIYVAIPVSVTLFGMLLYACISTYLPSLTRSLTGGR